MKKYYIEDEYTEREELSKEEFIKNLKFNMFVAVDCEDYQNEDEAKVFIEQELKEYGSTYVNGFTFSIEGE